MRRRNRERGQGPLAAFHCRLPFRATGFLEGSPELSWLSFSYRDATWPAARARALFSLSGHAPGQYGSRKVQRAQRTGGWPPGDWKPWIDAPAWGRAPERLPLGAVAAAALAVVVRHLVLELKRVGLASPAHHGT